MKQKAAIKPKPELLPEELSAAADTRPGCVSCGLFRGCRNPFIEPRVPKKWDGFGLFVGEGPGETEDKKGRFFVGESGKLLKTIRKAASYKKCHFAFANAVRCRPPGNANPTSKQIRLCRPFLLEAINTLKPKNIVLLGRTALTAARNKSGMSVVQARGREWEIVGSKKQVPTFATYHPAAILHGQTHLRDVIRDDLRALRRKKLQYPTRAVPRSYKELGYDTEFAPDGRLLTEGIASGKEAKSWESGAVSEMLSTIRKSKVLIGHNLPGDMDYLVAKKVAKDAWLRGDDIKDSLLLARLHDENRERGGYGLENLLCSEFRVKPWKEPTASQFKKNPDASLWAPHDRMERCRLDAWAAFQLASLYQDERQDLVRISHRIEMTLYRVGLAGAAMLNRRFSRLGREWQAEAVRFGDLVTRAAFKEGMTVFEPTNKEHTRELLFDRLGLKKMGYTKKAHKLLVGKKTLAELLTVTKSLSRRQIVQNILLFSASDKLAKTWYGGSKGKRESIKELLVPFPKDPRLSLLHNWINPLGAKTGRRSSGGTDLEISSGGRNSQNWPHPARKSVVSRWHKKGGKIASLDFNKLEPLMMAWRIETGTGKPSRLLSYFGGGGGYVQLAKDLLGKEIEEGTKDYKAIKSIYLGLGYGMNDWKLAHELWYTAGVKFSDDQEKHLRRTSKIRKRYFRMFPEVGEYHRQQKRELLLNERAVGELGMVRHLPHLGPEMKGYRHLQNQAINFPIQYLASLVTGSAMIDYEAALLKEHRLTYITWHKALLDDPYGLPCSPVVNEIHDELLLDMHPKTGKRDLRLLQEAMTEVPTLRKMIPAFKVELSIKTNVGESWT